MDEPPVAEAIEPEEAFAALADPIRIEILRALWQADEESTSFSRLREVVGVEDSGQFNYHLGKLRDRFVQKTDDGYALRAAGIHVVSSILAGAYTMEGSTAPITLEEPCPTCGGEWTFRYEDEVARLECSDCPIVIQYPVPPGTFVGIDHEALPDRTEHYLRTLVEQLRHRICPYCDAEILPTVVLNEPPENRGAGPTMPLVEYDCERCSGHLMTDVGVPLVDHPALVSFFYERGIDVREQSMWRFSVFDDDRTTVEDTDPLRVRVAFEAAGDRLELTVDEAMDVLGVEEP